jgi:hypothetical protein
MIKNRLYYIGDGFLAHGIILDWLMGGSGISNGAMGSIETSPPKVDLGYRSTY